MLTHDVPLSTLPIGRNMHMNSKDGILLAYASSLHMSKRMPSQLIHIIRGHLNKRDINHEFQQANCEGISQNSSFTKRHRPRHKLDSEIVCHMMGLKHGLDGKADRVEK